MDEERGAPEERSKTYKKIRRRAPQGGTKLFAKDVCTERANITGLQGYYATSVLNTQETRGDCQGTQTKGPTLFMSTRDFIKGLQSLSKPVMLRA